MKKKERSEFDTVENKYYEYYCDRCDKCVGESSDDLYPVNFAGIDGNHWCVDCIEEYADVEGALKHEAKVERINKHLNIPSEKQLFYIYMILSSAMFYLLGDLTMMVFGPAMAALMTGMMLLVLVMFGIFIDDFILS